MAVFGCFAALALQPSGVVAGALRTLTLAGQLARLAARRPTLPTAGARLHHRYPLTEGQTNRGNSRNFTRHHLLITGRRDLRNHAGTSGEPSAAEPVYGNSVSGA